MRASVPQRWRCLRGHDNEAEVRRCAVCRLPWWITWYTLAGAAAALLIGGIVLLMVLSHFLTARQYQEAVRQFLQDDGQISEAERKELEARRAYLGLSPDRARRLEEQMTRQVGVTGDGAAPPLQVSPPPTTPTLTLVEELQRVREALEQGRFGDVRQAVTALEAQYPQHAEVKSLQEEIVQNIRVRIEVKVLGETSGHYNLDAREALLGLTGQETGFYLYVEPYEQVYFYLYAIDRSGKVEGLFPVTQVHSPATNPLYAGQPYELPSTDPARRWYPLKKTVYTVACRWPARELEQWGSELPAEASAEAGRSVLQALAARSKAPVGGCDVRHMQFAGESNEKKR